MARVTIAVQPRPYQALIESGVLGRVGACLREVLSHRKRCFVVTVAPVRKKWGKKLMSSLCAGGCQPELLEMRDGERYKTLATLEELAEKLTKVGADRSAVVVAFGGGVVGDVTGMLASVYMRGVDVVQVPTTVQAQLDAAIGGKTGVNLRAGKNLVGTFHQPRVVLIDPQVLSTLPARQFRAGLYEGLKCGLIGNPALFNRFEQRRDQILRRELSEVEWLITESVKLKANVVSVDERESGRRRVLNLGHTIGHALEAQTGYRKFLHGEAVAWGIIAAVKIAVSMGKLDAGTGHRISDAVLGLGPLPKFDVRAASILSRLQVDKKTRGGVVHFVLPRDIGRVEIVSDVPQKVVAEAVNGIRRMSRS